MAQTSKPSIIGTGLISLDFVTNADAAPAWRRFAGGTCGNVLAILSYLDWDAYPVARLNGDNASQDIRKDLKRWGVKLDYASLHPTAHTPIIVQTNRETADGQQIHRFSWRCPSCQQYLPGFAPVRRDSVEELVRQPLGGDVFFFDRVSSGILLLAQAASESGAVVFFEPSAKTTDKQMTAALHLADIVKYSDQRYPSYLDAMSRSDKTRLEIQTRGQDGLMYRAHGLPRPKRWRKLPATKMNLLKDTAGAGDWFTANLINVLLKGGRDRLDSLTKNSLEVALITASAAAAWSCQFEGARGGMYMTSLRSYKNHVRKMREGKHLTPKRKQVDEAIAILPNCPACP